MRDLTPFKFAPEYQPEGLAVEFECTPLDMQSFYTLQLDMNRSGAPQWEVAEQVVRKHLVGWSGLSVPFSRQAKVEVLAGSADVRWVVWIGAICAELYRRALLSETERGN